MFVSIDLQGLLFSEIFPNIYVYIYIYIFFVFLLLLAEELQNI